MERRYKFIGLFIALAIFFSVLIFSPVFHTGFYVSEESEYDNLDKTWNFSNPENYSYNSSEISLAEGGASLKQIVTVFNWTEVSTLDYNLSSAFYNSKDKTNKIDSLGNGHIKPSSNKILDISFENELTNGDIINIYILSSSSGEIYICKAGSLCNFAEYGSVSHDGNEGFYNITISGLTDPTDSFRLVANKIKIDFIKALDINVTNHSFVNVTYPASSTIETEDIVDLKNIDSLEFLSSLNNQSINYSYSSDSGLTWNNILEDVSILNVSKIRFSAKLLSDTLGTPILEKIILIYDEMPEENSTNIKFSYTVNLTSNEPTTINSSNIFLDIMISKNVSYANITIEEIEDIPLESKKPLRSPIDLTVDDNTRELLNSTKLKIYYTDEDISLGNLDESTLKFYYYNESSLIWEGIDSTVNVDGNYIEVTLPHLSIYGVFGEERITPSQEDSSSGGSGWVAKKSGGSSAQPPVQEAEGVQEPFLETLLSNESIAPEEEREGLTGFPVFDRVVNTLNNRNIQIILIGILAITGFVLYTTLKRHQKKLRKIVTEGLKN